MRRGGGAEVRFVACFEDSGVQRVQSGGGGKTADALIFEGLQKLDIKVPAPLEPGHNPRNILGILEAHTRHTIAVPRGVSVILPQRSRGGGKRELCCW